MSGFWDCDCDFGGECNPASCRAVWRPSPPETSGAPDGGPSPPAGEPSPAAPVGEAPPPAPEPLAPAGEPPPAAPAKEPRRRPPRAPEAARPAEPTPAEEAPPAPIGEVPHFTKMKDNPKDPGAKIAMATGEMLGLLQRALPYLREAARRGEPGAASLVADAEAMSAAVSRNKTKRQQYAR